MKLVDFNFYRKEIKEGATILSEKVKKYRPKIAVFNGKGKCTIKFIKTKDACLLYMNYKIDK